MNHQNICHIVFPSSYQIYLWDMDKKNLKEIPFIIEENQTGNILATANGESGESAGTDWATTDSCEGVKFAYSKHEVCHATDGVCKK